MKKMLSILIAFCMVMIFTAGCSAQSMGEVEGTESAIILEIGNPIMAVNNEQMEIDPGRGTVPIVDNGHTLLPVRDVVEAMGGIVEWNEEKSSGCTSYLPLQK